MIAHSERPIEAHSERCTEQCISLDEKLEAKEKFEYQTSRSTSVRKPNERNVDNLVWIHIAYIVYQNTCYHITKFGV